MVAATQPVEKAQDTLVRLLGNTVEGRAPLVAGMLHRNASEATSYWLQLVVSIGIATLGLVTGSTAVVIGAMLVAPLMGPIIGLAMGLAAGSPFLVLRSAGRILMSVIVAAGGSAMITLLLPFHELNAELLARTSPTALDLITAAFCALAGVYASLRPGSETASTAAGTSIGISLVPPLCASGFGLGTASFPVAAGAALLFVTNMVAIVVVGTVAFVAAGFNRVDVVALEHDELVSEGRDAPIARALARRLAHLFESRLGPVLRVMMPFVLLAALYLPLRRALDEVAWEVRVRDAVRESIAREPMRVVQSRVRVEHHGVEVTLVLLGTNADATRTHARLDEEIRKAASVTPRLEVLAVPDATAFAGLESTLLTPRVIGVAPPEPTASPAEQLEGARARVRETLSRSWPSKAAGEPLEIDLDTAAEGPLRVRVAHLGAPLGLAAVEALSRSVGTALSRDVEVVDVAVPDGVLTRDDGDMKLVADVAAGAAATAPIASVGVCVVRPRDPKPPKKPSSADVALGKALDVALSRHPRVTSVTGDGFAVRFVKGDCRADAAPAPVDEPSK